MQVTWQLDRSSRTQSHELQRGKTILFLGHSDVSPKRNPMHTLHFGFLSLNLSQAARLLPKVTRRTVNGSGLTNPLANMRLVVDLVERA